MNPHQKRQNKIARYIAVGLLGTTLGILSSAVEAKVVLQAAEETEHLREAHLASSLVTQPEKRKEIADTVKLRSLSPLLDSIKESQEPQKITSLQPSALVPQTEIEPYRGIIQLEIKFKGFKNTVKGTGALISQTDIVTAAHCLYAKDYGLAESVTITLDGKPISTHFLEVSTRFKDSVLRGSKDPAFDYGVVTFDYPIGSTFFTLQAASKDLLTYEYNVTGYPAEEAGNLRTNSGFLQEKSGKTLLFYPFDTKEGQSGGPLWRKDPDSQTNVCIGIHNGQYTKYPYEGYGVGVKLTDAIIKDIYKIHQSNTLRSQGWIERLRYSIFS